MLVLPEKNVFTSSSRFGAIGSTRAASAPAGLEPAFQAKCCLHPWVKLCRFPGQRLRPLLAEIKVGHEPAHLIVPGELGLIASSEARRSESVGAMTDGGAGIELHQPHLMQYLANPRHVGDSAGYGPALTKTCRLARAREQSTRPIKPAEVIHGAAV